MYRNALFLLLCVTSMAACSRRSNLMGGLEVDNTSYQLPEPPASTISAGPLICQNDYRFVRSGATAAYLFSQPENSAENALEFANPVYLSGSLSQAGLVSLSGLDPWTLFYRAPNDLTAERIVRIEAGAGESRGDCRALLVKDGDIPWVALSAAQYASLPVSKAKFFKYVGQYDMTNYVLRPKNAQHIAVPVNWDVPSAYYAIENLNFKWDGPGAAALPGVPNAEEFWAIEASGHLRVRLPGEYTLILSSDDGAVLDLNGQEVLSTDGWHAVITQSTKVVLNEGHIPFFLRYFQGPTLKELRLEWIRPDGVRELVPLND